MDAWILAARPKTLVAGLIPVAMASALAQHHHLFQWAIFACALLGALFIQIGTNYVNDGADFQKGADGADRLGPARMAASGRLSPEALYWGAASAFLIATIAGIYLFMSAGPVILLIGVVSILFAIAYTAGPFPLAYLGLGDIFVLIFFGLVAVLGTYFAHAHGLNNQAIFLSFATGFHGVALIALNNLRDIPTDTQAGKKTLAVRLGDRASRWYYCALLFLPFFCWLPFFISLPSPYAVFPYLALPMAVANALSCFRITDRRQFNGLLGRTAGLQLIFGGLVCLSLVMA